MLHLTNVIGARQDLNTFAEQFTVSRGEFDFINVGPGKENADSKIRCEFTVYLQYPLQLTSLFQTCSIISIPTFNANKYSSSAATMLDTSTSCRNTQTIQLGSSWSKLRQHNHPSHPSYHSKSSSSTMSSAPHLSQARTHIQVQYQEVTRLTDQHLSDQHSLLPSTLHQNQILSAHHSTHPSPRLNPIPDQCSSKRPPPKEQNQPTHP